MMRRLLVLFLLFVPACAFAQVDVSASVLGQFPEDTTSNGVASNGGITAGVLAGVRRYKAPWLGYELTYAFDNANYSYSNAAGTFASVKAPQNTSTGDYVVNIPVPIVGLRPFGLAGAGFTHYTPQSGSAAGSESSTKPLFCYGVGLDYKVLPLVGMRFQYRALVYESPTFGLSGPSGSASTTKEPSVGVFVSF
jgi:hypothetical protein